jgi:hypothetical protein
MKNPASPGFCFVTTKFFSAWISTRSIRAAPCDIPLDLDAMLTDVAQRMALRRQAWLDRPATFHHASRATCELERKAGLAPGMNSEIFLLRSNRSQSFASCLETFLSYRPMCVALELFRA